MPESRGGRAGEPSADMPPVPAMGALPVVPLRIHEPVLLSVRPDSLMGACPPPRACGGDVGGSLIRSIADGLLTLHDLLELPPDVTLAPSPSSCAESKLPRRIGAAGAEPVGGDEQIGRAHV